MTSRIRLTPHNRARAIDMVRTAPDGHFFLPPAEPTRTLEQSAKLHAMLGDVSKQVLWPVNGKEERLSIDDWKGIVLASLIQEKRMAAGIRGGFVILGKRSSSLTIREMSEAIEFLYAFGDERGVVWSEPAQEIPEWARAA